MFRISTSTRITSGVLGLAAAGLLLTAPASGADPVIIPTNPVFPGCPIIYTNIIEGTADRDIIVGTPGNDLILGHGGGDYLEGRGGRDVLVGAEGNDTLVGGIGNDCVFGGPDHDETIYLYDTNNGVDTGQTESYRYDY